MLRDRLSLSSIAPCVILLFVSACESRQAPPPAPPPHVVVITPPPPATNAEVTPSQTASSQPAASQTAPSPTSPSRGDTATATSGSIHLESRIVATCGNLPEPHFAFDSAAIEGRAADTLKVVARCFRDGALAGRKLKLIGRTDPRGTAAYNVELGEDRAHRVAKFLESAGISSARITTVSRGEVGATGKDEEGWADDRRVDIVLGD